MFYSFFSSTQTTFFLQIKASIFSIKSDHGTALIFKPRLLDRSIQPAFFSGSSPVRQFPRREQPKNWRSRSPMLQSFPQEKKNFKQFRTRCGITDRVCRTTASQASIEGNRRERELQRRHCARTPRHIMALTVAQRPRQQRWGSIRYNRVKAGIFGVAAF